MEGKQGAASGRASGVSSGDSQGDDLTEITGIGDAIAKVLNDEGITTFAQLYELNTDEAERIEEKNPGFKGRIDVEAWRDQALDLATQAASKSPKGDTSPAPPPMGGAIGSAFSPQDPAPPPPPEEPSKTPEPQAGKPDPAMAALMEQVAALTKTVQTLQNAPAAHPNRQRGLGNKRSHVMPNASEGGTRRRLNIHRKFSDITGSDPNLPDGAIFQQVVKEDGEDRVAYFGNDGVQRFFADADADVLDYDDIENEHEVTPETVNLRHYLDGKVDYPLGLVVNVMRERFGFDGKSKREVMEELHRITRRNR